MVLEWGSVIPVSLNVGGGVRLIKPAKLHVHAKHYKHNEDGRTAPGVCGSGSVPLSHSGNVVMRIPVNFPLKVFLQVTGLTNSSSSLKVREIL